MADTRTASPATTTGAVPKVLNTLASLGIGGDYNPSLSLETPQMATNTNAPMDPLTKAALLRQAALKKNQPQGGPYDAVMAKYLGTPGGK